MRYLSLRDVDWRVAFQTGLAAYVAEFKKEKKAEAEAARQRAWAEYRQQVFAEAEVASSSLVQGTTSKQ